MGDKPRWDSWVAGHRSWALALHDDHLDARFTRIYPQAMQVSLKYAEEHLADLVSAAYRGEEVEIAEPDQPPVRLMLVVANGSVSAEPRPPRQLGRLNGLIGVPSDEEWAATDGMWTTPERPRAELFGSLAGKIELADDWDSPETNKEIADLFENSEVFPDTSRP